MDQKSVRHIIEKLLIVQERDCDLARCRRELSDIPAQRQQVEAALQQHRAALDANKEAIKARQLNVRQIEGEIGSLRQQIDKLREQQFQIKSNNEFKVLGKEIESLRNQLSKTEDKELAVMENIEQIEQEAEALRNNLAKAEETVRIDLQRLDERQKNLEREIEELLQKRSDLTQGLDAEWLKRYNHVMENRKDIAIVGVENAACSGCHMKLPPHVIQDVKRDNAMVSCAFCGRLLYWIV